MPTPTYTPLATVTLGSSASSVTFGSIPTDGTYRDLILTFDTVGSTYANILVRFNGDSGTNYPWVRMFGTGSSTGSSTGTFSGIYVISTEPTIRSQITCQIFDYSATDKHKTALTRWDQAATGPFAVAARWANTAAVNTIFLAPQSGTFEASTTINLYGIAS